MKPEFHTVTPAIADAFGEFLRSLQENGDESFFHPHPLTHAEAVRIAALNGRDRYYVAVSEGIVIGYGMLRGWEEGYDVPSVGLAIHPAYRGKGIGPALMLFLHGEAKRSGALQVRLTVDSRNPAVSLYRRMGYEFTGEFAGTLIGHLTFEGIPSQDG